MLLSRRERDRIVLGGIVPVFRRWRRPTVKTGGTLRTAIGVLSVVALNEVRAEEISEDDAAAAGFASGAALIARLAAREGIVYRVELRLQGEDPRIALRSDDTFDAAAVAALRARLDRFDSPVPWTVATLTLIADRPNVRAEELASALGLDKPLFKRRVCRLKELGLTESLEVGYRLSPRGQSLLRWLSNINA